MQEFIAYHVADTIDRLISLDIKAQGVIPTLYQAAREIIGEPLVLNAARGLLRKAKPGARVLLCTGFVCPPGQVGETDGPVGAVVLARALEVALKIHPVIVCEEEIMQPVVEMCSAAGLNPYTDISAISNLDHSVAVVSFTKEDALARNEAVKLVDFFQPIAAISIERPGKNSKGVYHMGGGTDVSVFASKIDILFEDTKGDYFTIGIGDLGNELGLGALKKVVRNSVMYGSECQCPCKGGIAADTEADALIIASVSDWGAYGLAAEVAFLTKQLSAFHTSDLERTLLRVGAQNGLIDGPTGYRVPWIDGINEDIHANLVGLLRGIIEGGSTFPERAQKMYEFYSQHMPTKKDGAAQYAREE